MLLKKYLGEPEQFSEQNIHNSSLNFNFEGVVSHSVVNDVSLKIRNVCVGGLLRLTLRPLLITKVGH